ncbi:MAG: hypothetical protein JW733_01110 [Coriobacteriia bacterium]|nr:hypothetical protein [Coriobacteriia bacterium]MBN2847961.1 hypothetical protein [Coriobacteriia bacterium]
MTNTEKTTWDGIERRVTKRRHHRRYRFIDRRHGFDRRGRYPILGTMRDHAWLVVFTILLINVLSFLDGWFTAAELGLGIAREGNPVLAAANRQGPLTAIAVKFGAMAVVSTTIWFGRHKRSILALALVAVALFGGLVAYHAGTLRGMGLL